MLAVVWPPSRSSCQKSPQCSLRFTTISRNPPAAPTAPASVGVTSPPQIPPKTIRISRTTAQHPPAARAAFRRVNGCPWSSTPPSAGLKWIIVRMPIDRTAVTTSPGTMPAMKSLPIPCSVTTP